MTDDCPACRAYPLHAQTHGASPTPPANPTAPARGCETDGCTTTAIIEIKLMPRPSSLFAGPVWRATCGKHYQLTRLRGTFLDQRALGN